MLRAFTAVAWDPGLVLSTFKVATIVSKFSSRDCDALFRPLQALYMHDPHIHMQAKHIK